MTKSSRPTVAPVDGWVVDLTRLRRDHRGRRGVSGELPVADLMLPSASVPTGRVGYDLDVDASRPDVVVSGALRFPWRTECRRCLDSITGVEEIELREVFQAAPVEGETWPVVDDEIDLEPMVREVVLLALPTTVVCVDDCRGPSAAHLITLPTDEARSDGSVDPRWAALDDLEFD